MNKITEQEGNREDASRQTRRQVLKTAAGVGLVLLLPLQAARAEAAAATWTAVGKVTDFVPGQPKRVALPGGIVLYVTRIGTKKRGVDALFAVSAKCTHRGCEIGAANADNQFVCPCHGAVFAATGKNLHGTRRRPDEALPDLPAVPVREKDGQVQVNLQAAPAEELEPQHES